MKKFGLAQKFLLLVGSVLLLVFATLTYAVSSLESGRAEKAFEDQCSALAIASGSMFHQDAEAYCKSMGMRYHRVRKGQSGGSAKSGFEQSAMAEFARDKSIKFKSARITDEEGHPALYVLAPGFLKESCNTCHGAYGIDVTKGAREGDLIAGFGVSVSTTKLAEDQRRTWIIATVIAFAVLGGLALVLRQAVATTVIAPLGGLATAFAGMAEGDLRVQASVGSRDEIGALAAAFNHMVAQLRQIMGEVTAASERVASGSTQLAASADEMADTVELTARVGEELRDSGQRVRQAMVRLNDNVKSMAGHTTKTRSGANEAMKNAAQGSEAGRGAAAGMDQIQEATSRIVEAVQAIQGIARQTNLLSLNAAIEAAKAGSQGKGFAVVAEEVRKLAERSSQSAREIEGLIAKTQEAVAGGRAGVDHTLERLESIRAQVDQVREGITLVGGLSDEQGSASDEVSELTNATAGRLDQNAAATHELSATVTQVARTSEELSKVAESLRELVKRFRL